ncbi:MAG TPA: hypothetical protein PKC79_03520 [Solidesulfovibrio magneticus]|nr:hypothetical protein [Solidesulfovibrio magneticus]
MKHHIDAIIDNLRKDMPPVCSREAIERFTGGLIRRRHLANLDCAGRGPSGKVRLGKRTIGYERHAFLLWLAEHLTSTDQAESTQTVEGAQHVSA